QGQVLEGEGAVAAAEEREESNEVEQGGDHRRRFCSEQSYRINRLAAGWLLAKYSRYISIKSVSYTTLAVSLPVVFAQKRRLTGPARCISTCWRPPRTSRTESSA